MVNFGPLAAEIVSSVWGTPGNFNGFRVLAALLHGTLVVGVSQTAALNRGRHLYSAGRPSRWALAHISSIKIPLDFTGGALPGGCRRRRQGVPRSGRVSTPRRTRPYIIADCMSADGGSVAACRATTGEHTPPRRPPETRVISNLHRLRVVVAVDLYVAREKIPARRASQTSARAPQLYAARRRRR